MNDLKTLKDGYIDRLRIAHGEKLIGGGLYRDDIRLFLDFLEEGGYQEPGAGLEKYVQHLADALHDPHSKISKPATCKIKLTAAKAVVMYIVENVKGLPGVSFEDVYKIESAIKSIKGKRFGGSEALDEGRVPSRAEVEQVIDGCTDVTIKLMVEFLSNTGVRISELLTIPLTQVKANGKVKINVLGKGNKSRTVQIPKSLHERIRAHFGGSTYLFEHNGKPYNRNSVTQRIKHWTLKTIGREISAHGFRHYLATYLLNEKRYELKRVSLMLGHSSVSVTADIYQSVMLRDEDWETGFIGE